MRGALVLPLLLAAYTLSGCSQGAYCGLGQAVPPDGDDSGAFLYQPDSVLDLHLFVDRDNLEDLPDSADDDRDDVHATVAFGGDEFGAGLRLKGDSSFRTMERKAALKIDFGEFDDDNSFYGVRRLTLNNMVQDDSTLSENLTYWLHATVGGVAPRHGYACVRVNGDAYGLYSVVETMDEEFLERNFDDPGGNLYEGGYGADVRSGRAELFDKEESGEPSGTGDIRALFKAVEGASPDTYLSVLDDYFVLDELLGMWAVELFVGNLDSYLTRSNNYLLYHEPASGEWTMIPWGADQAFREGLYPTNPFDPDAPAEHGRLFEDCLDSPACVAALFERIEDVAALAEEREMFTYAVWQRDQIAYLSRSDPRSECSSLDTRGAQSDVLSFVKRRPDQIRVQLEHAR